MLTTSRTASGTPARPRPFAAPGRVSALGRWLAHHRGVLLVAFAFTVMADPVSSVAYAVEAALRALGGDPRLLLPTMAVVIGLWVRAGRPRGISEVERYVEAIGEEQDGADGGVSAAPRRPGRAAPGRRPDPKRCARR